MFKGKIVCLAHTIYCNAGNFRIPYRFIHTDYRERIETCNYVIVNIAFKFNNTAVINTVDFRGIFAYMAA